MGIGKYCHSGQCLLPRARCQEVPALNTSGCGEVALETDQARTGRSCFGGIPAIPVPREAGLQSPWEVCSPGLQTLNWRAPALQV